MLKSHFSLLTYCAALSLFTAVASANPAQESLAYYAGFALNQTTPVCPAMHPPLPTTMPSLHAAPFDLQDCKQTHFKDIKELRAGYTCAVGKLAAYSEHLKSSCGLEIEGIARNLHHWRREMGRVYKSATHWLPRTIVYLRNYCAYGDSLGPTVEHLRAKKSWEQIAESAARPGGEDLGLTNKGFMGALSRFF